MSMFCFQCQETAKGTGCTVRGVCGKIEDIAKLQDLLILTLKGISYIVAKGKLDAGKLNEINHQMMNSLFMTITNANWDGMAFEEQIKKMLAFRNELKKTVDLPDLPDAATFEVDTRENMLDKAAAVGVLATANEDVRSLRETVTYGLKGMAAYA